MRPGEDGRMRRLRITPEGERMLGKAYPLWERAQHEVAGALGEDRYEALLGDVARAISLVAEGSHDALGGPAKGPQT
jgi:DNA-binding MarR family transcriptional regulator